MKTFEISIKFCISYLNLNYPEFKTFVDSLLPRNSFEITYFSLDLTDVGLAEIEWISNGIINYNEMQDFVQQAYVLLAKANTPILNLEILNV